MTDVRSRFSDPRHHRGAVIAVVGLALLGATVVPLALLGGPGGHAVAETSSELHSLLPARDPLLPEAATSIVELGPVPTEAVVGVPTAFAWEALDAIGARATTFAVDCELTVTVSANGSSESAWANGSTTGPLDRSANGTFSVPSATWADGVLNLSLSAAPAVPVTVRLFGPLLPSQPAPVAFEVRPDLDHLVLYKPLIKHPDNRSNDTFWHVRDRFGDPTPGAFLIVEYSTNVSVSKAFVPVTWTTGGTTGAWVNYSAPGSGAGTLTIVDEANTTLIGPIPVPALGTSTASPSTASLSPYALAAVVLLTVAAVVGMASLVYGGRPRPPPARTDEEEDLQRLAEGRETIVDLVRRAGALGLREIETAWDPPPAPTAVADWVASLVTDGTLTVTLGEGGRARFSLADRPSREPSVTLDEEALARGIARRDAVVEGDEDGPP